MESINFTSIDLETATSARHSICEIGITVVKNGIVTENKSWLVRPEGNTYDYFNIGIHGITPDMTKNAPPFKDVWKKVEPHLINQVVVAHNTSFDMYALRDAFIHNNILFPTFKHYCSCRIAKYVVKDCYSYSLPNICEVLNIPFGEHHRAGDDSLACANLFIRCLNMAEVKSLDELQNKYNFRCGEFDRAFFKPQTSISLTKSTIRSQITGDPAKIDKGNYFYNKVVCFTGSFQYGIRVVLLQAIADIGGIPVNSVTRQTNVLVVGQQDFKKIGESGISSKQKKAMELKEKGVDIEIMSEKDFLMAL